MLRLLAALLALAVLPPRAALAHGGPTGLTGAFSLGGGGELGLDADEGDAGVFELEAAVGYDLGAIGVRPELALVFGASPDSHVALRPGVRIALPRAPFHLRVSLDAANARGEDFGWRWLLVGVAAELRLTGVLGLFAEADTGAMLSADAGVPLLLRAGASFRF